jgi:hypothetical protein
MSIKLTEQCTVWGDSREPVFSGSGEECMAFIERTPHSERDDLYIMTEGGKEFVLDGNQWVEV